MSDNFITAFRMEMKNRNYSHNTIHGYCCHVIRYITYSNKMAHLAPDVRLRQFLYSLRNSHEQARLSYQAIKLFYQLVLKKECPYSLNRVKTRKRLPVTLSKTEVLEIFGNVKNKKHYLTLALMYGSGLRISEVVKIRVRDLNLDEKTLRIVDSKSNKDRISVISDKLIDDLKAMVAGKDQKSPVFVTQQGRKYSKRTIQMIFKRALAKAGIRKKATCHSLRHSFATHLIDNGVDIRNIKTLLGHSSVKTTMIYLHLTDPLLRQVLSPL
jgi:integrase/recombinase XerD